MVSNILIERPSGAAKVTISTARPGIVIGKKGEDIEKLQRELTNIMGVPAQVSINEIDRPDLDARLVAEAISRKTCNVPSCYEACGSKHYACWC
ncbi:30S ribosomal protein S3 [Acinetobacter baumannii]|nr:30S ribosomal protein S3 [Acinetobacter baumannii]